MKAVANVALISAVSVLTVIGVFSFSIAYQSHAVIKGLQERNIVESVNQMKFIELGMEQAAAYSTYQTAYNVLKYGTYTDGRCAPASLNDIPYWRVFDQKCYASVEDAIKQQQETETSDIFNNGYIVAIKKEYDITIPKYSTTIQLGSEKISASMSASDEITFGSEKLKISNLYKIKNEIKLPLKRLIDFGVEKFVNVDKISEKIKLAHEAMFGVSLDSSLVKNPGWATPDLNDGRLTGNCKSTKFEICIDPRITPDFTYALPKKSDLTTENCESTLREKIIKNVNDLNKDPEYHTQTTDASVETRQDLVKIKVDVGDENSCQTPNPEANSNSCDCVQWACPAGHQVYLGDVRETAPLGAEDAPSFGKNVCADCFNIIRNPNTGGLSCVRWSPKVCLSGTPTDGMCESTYSACASGTYDFQNDNCKLSENPCTTGTLDTSKDKCVAETNACESRDFYTTGICIYVVSDKIGCDPGYFSECTPALERCTCTKSATCAAGTLNTETGKCVEEISPSCSTGTYDTITNDCRESARCSSGDVQEGSTCINTFPKECPSGTSDINGKCYKTTRYDTECGLHKTLYTKACNYNYQADVTTLVNVKDTDTKGKYPVYDTVEKKTDFRNLELQFYVLSRN